MHLRTIALFTGLTIAAFAAHAQTYPSQGETPVTDDAEIIDAVEEAKLAERIIAIEQQSGADVAVVTLPATQFYTMGDDLDVYTQGLMEEWQLGSTTDGKAVLLLVFRDDRELRLEVTGAGDDASAAAQKVIDEAIVPRFREDDFGGGISLGVEGIANDILMVGADAPVEEAPASDDGGDESASEGGGGNILIWIGGIIAAIIAFFVAMGRRAKAKLAATPCPSCGKTGLTRERVTVEEATTEAAGKGEVRTTCPHCGHVDAEAYTIAKLEPKPDEEDKPKSSGGASGEWYNSA